jgi:hypothetical protein
MSGQTLKEQNPTVVSMWQTADAKHEEPASDHKETSGEGRHNQDMQDQQNQEAVDSKLSHQDDREEKHSSHQAGESATVEKLPYSEPSEWSLA